MMLCVYNHDFDLTIGPIFNKELCLIIDATCICVLKMQESVLFNMVRFVYKQNTFAQQHKTKQKRVWQYKKNSVCARL